MSKTKLTLIVTVRGDDPHLARTMRTARETAGVDIHRILVVDGGRAPEGIEAEHVHCLKTSRGVQAARHAGIQHAKTSLLVFTDAHMGFSDGWGREVCAFYRYPQRAKTVACSQMRFIGADGAQPDSTLYRGCRMSWKTIDSVNGRTDRKEHNILVAKWGGGGQPGGKIGAIMGAFYAFRRAWYEDLACPWECGTSWGRDEEVISMASWLGGGDVRLLPESVTVSHIDVGAGRWTPTDADTIGMMCNRARMIELFPWTPAEREELFDWFSVHHDYQLRPEVQAAVEADRTRPEVLRVKARFADCRPALDAFLARWMDKPETITCTTGLSLPEPPEPRRTNPQVIVRKREVCIMCNGVDSFRVDTTKRAQGIQYMRCSLCGSRAVRRNVGPMVQGVAAGLL